MWFVPSVTLVTTSIRTGRGASAARAGRPSSDASITRAEHTMSWRMKLMGSSSSCAKADLRMRAVAEGFRAAAAAAAQPRGFHARDDAPGAADDLHVAAHLQRPVGQRID